MRPEASLTPDCCLELAKGGALALSLGVESGSKRVLGLINKGIDLKTIEKTIHNLADAGIAAECMCFTDFPTENAREAFETIDFLKQVKDKIALFICGRFDLVPGAWIVAHYQDFGIREIWTIKGDDIVKKLFYSEKKIGKTGRDSEKIDMAIEELAQRFRLHKYPWAGSLSTAHTLLWYDHSGIDIFRKTGKKGLVHRYRLPVKVDHNRAFDVENIAERVYENESEIWEKMVFEDRSIRRKTYEALARKYSLVRIRQDRA